tara:strand:+ start:147 stop:1223 length:1077 start_codon:yes stop_codon:yes gene_type:complete
MELQKYISENNEYLTQFKEHKLYVRKYSKHGLCIVKMHYGKDYDFEMNPWMKYCRGAVIDINKHKVICIPPQKARQTNNIEKIIEEYNEEYIYEPLFDGTMVNMFHHNDQWMISTRSNIGAKNSWDGKQSFLNMFLDVNGDNWFNELNKNYCYSFVLHHLNNRNVSPIEQNALFLVENYEIKEDQINKVPLQEIESINNVFPIEKDMINSYNGDLFFSIKGFTIKTKTERINWINPNFEYVKDLKMNHNDKYLNYILLKQKRLLSQYLIYFPEDRFLFDEYRDEFNAIKLKLYERYVSRFIRKEIETKDIEYPLKPLVYELHTHYKESGEKINIKVVSDYLHQLDGKKMMFIRKYFKE